MRKAMAHITSQIMDVFKSPERGLTIMIGGKGVVILSFTFCVTYILSKALFTHPRVAYIIADEKDQSSVVTGLFSASSLTRRPCNMCLLDFQAESLTQVGIPRSLSQMRDVRRNVYLFILYFISIYNYFQFEGQMPPYDVQQFWSQHAEPNPLLHVPGLDVTKSPICTLHNADHGIFVKILEHVIALVHTHNDNIRDEFEERFGFSFDISIFQCINIYILNRWGKLIPFHGLRLFPGGVMDLAYVKGFEHRSMAVALPYVLHNLISATDIGERVAVSYATWRKAIDMYDFSDCVDADTDIDVNTATLDEVESLGCQLQHDMNELKQWLHEDPEVEFEGIYCEILS